MTGVIAITERMTLTELQAYVGPPSGPSTSYFVVRGEFLLTAWRDSFNGERGWWCAITQGRLVLAITWVAGSRFERDRQLAKSLEDVKAFLGDGSAS